MDEYFMDFMVFFNSISVRRGCHHEDGYEDAKHGTGELPLACSNRLVKQTTH